MSIKELKEREKEQRRNYIIDVAEKQFLSRGYDSVSMSDIAEAVELNKATLYLYFTNKESLYFAVALRGVLLMNEMFESAAGSEKTGMEKVRAIGEAYFTFYDRHPLYYRLLTYISSGRFNLSLNEDSKELHQQMHRMMDVLYRAIKEGVEDSTIRGDIDPMELAVYIITVSEKVTNPDFGMKSVLEERGIGYEQYVHDTMMLIGQSIEKRA